MRPIDADELYLKIKAHDTSRYVVKQTRSGAMAEKHECLHDICMADTIDIGRLPMRTGKWQTHTYIPHKNYCPYCEQDSPYNKRWRCCPNCGAQLG